MKTCEHKGCTNPRFSHGLCVRHWKWKYWRVVLKNNPDLKTDSRKAKRIGQYLDARDEYLKKHPICEFPDCWSSSVQLHHKRGRTGALLADKRYFCSLCFKHHRWVEDHPKEAREMGLVQSRLSNV